MGYRLDQLAHDLGDSGGLTPESLIRPRYMSPVFPIANVDDSRLADAVSSSGGTMGLMVEQNVSDLIFGQNSGVNSKGIPRA